jgi:hypothetical protein
LEVRPDIVRLGPHSGPLKGARLSRTDRAALTIALIIAGGAGYIWFLGIIGLWGRSQLGFDRAMVTWLAEIELSLALPAWLLLRAANVVVRMRTRHHA